MAHLFKSRRRCVPSLGSQARLGQEHTGDLQKQCCTNFLCEGRGTLLESADQVAQLVKEWLEGTSPHYFIRDWQLEGIKKDSVGIRVKWAELWAEYRRNPEQVPDRRNYRQPARI
jgi:hypothetical protein